MNTMKLSKILMIIGGILSIISLIWWGTAFKGEEGAFKCLYSLLSWECGLLRVLAPASKTAYNPLIFWVGLIILSIGIIIFLARKK